MNIKALVFDLDGTAVPNQRDGMPSERVISAIKRAKEKIPTLVATGRPLFMCKHILQKFNLHVTCAVHGGAELVNPQTFEVIERNAIPKNIADTIVNHLKQYDVTLFEGEDELEDPVQLGAFALQKKDARAICQFANSLQDISCSMVHAWTNGTFDVHINHANGTKEEAIATILQTMALSPENTMIVGDSNNDLGMMKQAGFGVAMANGSEEMKQLADFVTKSVDEDGLAYAVEKFVLQDVS